MTARLASAFHNQDHEKTTKGQKYATKWSISFRLNQSSVIAFQRQSLHWWKPKKVYSLYNKNARAAWSIGWGSVTSRLARKWIPSGKVTKQLEWSTSFFNFKQLEKNKKKKTKLEYSMWNA